MAMTVKEARAVGALVEWLTAPAGAEDVSGDAARDAAIYLADRARATLQAGVRGDHVRDGWPAPGRPRGARKAALVCEQGEPGRAGAPGEVPR